MLTSPALRGTATAPYLTADGSPTPVSGAGPSRPGTAKSVSFQTHIANPGRSGSRASTPTSRPGSSGKPKRMSKKEREAAEREAARVEAARLARAAILPDMKEGMFTLLKMHNPDELMFLTRTLGLPDDMTKEARLQALDDIVLVDEAAYRKVLKLIWEGIIIEYWRSLGKSIKHYKFDLRMMVWSWWLRSRDAVDQSDSWIPIYTPLEDQPDRVVEEHVTDDDRVSTWLKGMKDQEQSVREAERGVRLRRDYGHLMTFLGGQVKLRNYEAKGREIMLADLQLVRKHLETANNRNKELFTQLGTSREQLVKLDDERLDWKRKYFATDGDLREVRSDMESLKEYLGHTLKEVRAENKKIRMTLDTTAACLAEFQRKFEDSEQGNRELQANNEMLRQEVRDRTHEISAWAVERGMSRNQMGFMVGESVQQDILIETLLHNNAMSAVRVEELNVELVDRQRELREMALMLHAEDETRLAMVVNPAAFKNPKKKKGKGGKRGRSPTKKKKGGGKGGSKSKGRSKSKSKAKGSKSPVKKGKKKKKKK